MKKRIAVIVLAAILILLAAGVPILMNNYLFVSGGIYPQDLQALDLSGKKLGDLSRLPQLSQLQQLDLRGTGITPAQYEAIQAKVPNCQVEWLLPFQGNYLPLDTDTLTITGITQQEMEDLRYLTQLQVIDATGCQDHDALLQLQAMYPNCQVRYQLDLDSTLLNQDATTADLPNASAEAVAQALVYLPKLTQINAQGCRDYEALMALQQQYPQCKINYTVAVGNTECPQDSESVTLPTATAEALAEALPYLLNLTMVTIETPMEDPTPMLALKEAYPQIVFAYSFYLLEKIVSSQDTLVDLSGIPMEDTVELEAALPHFYALEKVDMCGCGFADEDMGALNDKYDAPLFVWEIRFGSRSVRTDTKIFMPYKLSMKLSERSAKKLKYLTEVECMDLGHNMITDTSFLHYMTKMKYLVLADSTISDISGCANMPDLIYAEFFMSSVKDYSPLLQCKKLEDLNVSYTKPEDPLIFGQMKQLKNLWFRSHYKDSIYQQLSKALPNTNFVYDYGTATDGGWRELPNYYAMRDMLDMPYMTG